MKKTIIIMPVANEEETMRTMLDEILALPYEDLYVYPVVDAFSKDKTEHIIREYEKRTERVKCIFYRESKGVVSCYLEGFRRALLDGAEQIIEMDGGGSHLPKEIPQFIGYLEQGYDCVFGSRFIKGGAACNRYLYRRVLSRGGTILANVVLGTRLKDMTSGFEGFQKEVLMDLNFNQFLSTGHMYQTEMRFYCRNRKCVEVPIHYRGGKSSLRLRTVGEAFRVLFHLKSNELSVVKVCKNGNGCKES